MPPNCTPKIAESSQSKTLMDRPTTTIVASVSIPGQRDRRFRGNVTGCSGGM
jgi:hypothetical protein